MRNTVLANILGLLLMVSCSAQELEICRDGKTAYKIVAAGSAESQEAARTLKNYLEKALGTKFEITSDISTNQGIFIGSFKSKPNPYLSQIRDGGFSIFTSQGDLYIEGKGRTGTLNGMYTFLEKVAGISMLAPSVVIFPESKDLIINRNLKLIENPAFILRDINNDLALKDDFRKWHKLNNMKHNPDWGLIYHTFFKLVPPGEFFAQHPEYYSLRQGKRVKRQLCMSNSSLPKVVADRLQQEIKSNPDATFWFVSQEDNNDFCECTICKQRYEKYGSPSGLLIEFINKIANNFPEKKLVTLAYNKTLKPPKEIKPLDNVVICFAPINASHNLGYAEDLENKKILSYFKDWKKLSSNLMFWDYWVGFGDVLLPFPNIPTLQANMKFFQENAVQYVYEEGINQKGGELKELKTYLLARLLWDPNIDLEKEIQFFCDHFYGPAASEVSSYIKLSRQDLMQSRVALKPGHTNEYRGKCLTAENLKKYDALLDRAQKSVAGMQPYEARVKTLRTTTDFYMLEAFKGKQLALTPSDVRIRKERLQKAFNSGTIGNIKVSKPGSFNHYLKTF